MKTCPHCSNQFEVIPRDREVFCSRACYFESKKLRSVRTAEKRFRARCAHQPSGCIEWTGVLMPNGYGQFSVLNRHVYAHRFSYELHKGSIPDGLCVLHSCDNRGCVNPDHLSLGTKLDNAQDARSRGRIPMGADRPSSKLTPDAVLKIRAARAAGESFKAIGRRFNISAQTVHKIHHRRLWPQI